MSFGSNFKQLREAKGLTQKQLLQDFNQTFSRNYTAAAISQYENDKRIPETAALTDFATYFNCSVDYLLDLPATESSTDLLVLFEQIQQKLHQGTLTINNTPIDDETKQLLIISLQNNLTLCKALAKQNYTPRNRSH